MNDSDAAGMVAGRREVETDLCAQNVRLAKTNARLRVGLVGIGMLVVGFGLGGLGGLAEGSKDSVVAYTATDRTLYRVYESGRIEYLRVDDDPPRTADGAFGWGEFRIDDRYELSDRP
jgi:hypothetical protein